ncbi:MAG: prolipoprotein diacylglyceryl transferase [Bradymonadia bacterium]
MHPVLLNLFGYPIHLYAVMIATGFIGGVWLSARYGERVGLDRDMILDLCWWLLVAGLVGARIGFIVTQFDQYYLPCVDVPRYNELYPDDPLTEPDCFRLLKFWNGGLVFLGGVVLALFALVWFTRREGVKLLPVADALIPSLALGQFFGRLGCLAAGCCWGKVTEAPWAIHFPKGSMVHYLHAEAHLIPHSAVESMGVHPTQLYDAGAGLLIFGLLIWIRQRKTWHGQVFAWWLLLYPLARSTIELFRGDDEERGFLFEVVSESLNEMLGLPPGSITFLSTSQFISLCLAAVAVYLILRHRKQGAANDPPSAPTSAPPTDEASAV